MNWLTRPLVRVELSPLRTALLLLLVVLGAVLWLRSGMGLRRDRAQARMPSQQSPSGDPCAQYLDLMKLSLTDLLYETEEKVRTARWKGQDWPGRGYTMIGIPRLDNIQQAVDDVLARRIPGDLIEAGAWRGGATMFMRAILKCRGVVDRTVWVADSFEGLPPPDVKNYPADAGFDFSMHPELAVSLESVQANFARYGLLDDKVRFLKGWFKDSLKQAPMRELAVLRIDADLYESTTDALKYLYPKLAGGGYVIVDDYYSLAPCRKAVQDYRGQHGITTPIKTIDATGSYWIKE